MSLLDRARGWLTGRRRREDASSAPPEASTEVDGGLPPTAAATPDPAPNSPRVRALALLQSLAGGHSDHPEAVAALGIVAGTTDERAGLRAILAACDAGRAPEALRVVAAGLFVARGEPTSARRLLEDATSVAALTLRAEAEERAGDLALARGTLERVLAVDIDAVGVRARAQRLREATGGRPVVPTAEQPTLTAPEEAHASFRVLSEIGRGGASAVFRAEDLRLGRTLALKVFHRPREQRAQLSREAELAVRARGPGVVRVFDADPELGFLAMELAEGGALRRALRGKQADRAPGTNVDSWLSTLVHALARVHALGLVHGDVKAGNILFRGDGEALLADFGLARAVGERYEGGTPGTLSPERISSGVAHPDDDVFALGVLLREALVSERAPVRAALSPQVVSWTSPRGIRPDSARVLVLTSR